MAAPPITERHKPHFHRQAPVKELCRAATTANGTLATAYANGQVIDGITLATGDRILLKDQTTGADNGIYTVNAAGAPTRDYDVSTVDPGYGWLVLVLSGTANAGTLWKNTNTSTPTIGSTALTFAQFTSGGLTDPMTTRGDIIVRNASNVTARLGIGGAGTVLSSDGTDVSWGTGGGSGTVTTVKDEGTNLSTAVVSIDFVGAGVTATGTTAVTVTIPGGTSALTLITSTTLGSAAADITFTGLSGAYKDLILVIKARGASTGDIYTMRMRVGNGSIDTGSNYAYWKTYGGSIANGTDSTTSDTFGNVGGMTGSSSPSGTFGQYQIEILGYAVAAHYKDWLTHGFQMGTGSLHGVGGGAWKNSASAIDQVRIYADTGNLDTGSSVFVYGRS